MTFIAIADPSDPRLEPYRLVRDRDREAAGARAARQDRDAAGTNVPEGAPGARTGLFIGETAVVIQAMLREPGCTVSILAAERHEQRVRALLAAAASAGLAQPAVARMQEPDVYLVPERIVEPLTGFNLHRGLLAVGRRPAARAVLSIVPPAGRSGLLLCVESVNNMDNIGQLFRVAAAFGCCGVLLSPDCHDPLYRKSLRVSCGCALAVPHARSVSWHDDLSALHAVHGFTLVGATGSADLTLDQFAAQDSGADDGAPPVGDPARATRRALLVGAEFSGLTPQTLQLCQRRVRIPMAPGVDSLNVAVAAAVFLSRLAPTMQR